MDDNEDIEMHPTEFDEDERGDDKPEYDKVIKKRGYKADKLKPIHKRRIRRHEEELKAKIANIDWKALNRIDPRNSEYQAKMFKKAIFLLDQLLDFSMETTKYHLKVSTLLSFLKYREHLNKDTTYPIEMILKCTPKQLEVVRTTLKEKSLLRDFASGNMGLNEIFGLPQVIKAGKDEKKEEKNEQSSS